MQSTAMMRLGQVETGFYVVPLARDAENIIAVPTRQYHLIFRRFALLNAPSLNNELAPMPTTKNIEEVRICVSRACGIRL